MTEPVAALWIRVGQQLTALPATGWALAVGVLATITASLWWKPTHLSSRWSSARWFVGGVVVCLAVAHAWSLRWIADDAFISFRYARNLVEGHGLVFNPGERVEGYTNFLWTVLLAGAYAIGIPFGLSAIAFGLLSVVAVLWLTTRLSQLLSPYHHRPLIPVAALLLASNFSSSTP
ncbi:MAG TPA: hypothetical protein PKW66_14560 [Polyangiaceae bacterium]|nr:hypothetical protein [Polyangiaceae bacterium]